jgi:type II secretory pathway pseudopilin PulG
MKNKKIKKGMTLVDMLIAIGIFSMGMIGFTVLFVRVWQSNSFIMEEGQATMMASRTVQQLIESLRKVKQADNGEFAIKSGDDFNFIVYLDDDNDGVTERVHYFLAGESFKKGVTKPTTGTPPVYPNGDQVITIMANYVTNTAAQPIFYYYNKDYPGDIVNNPLNISPTLPIDKVKLVRIRLWINIKPLTAPDNVNFESFVDLRNLNENL